MILNEVSVERLSFTCGSCGRVWSADYDVQHVEDGHGHDRDYYFDNGLARPDPTAPGVTFCPACGHDRTTVSLTARRVSPVVAETSSGDLGTRPPADKSAARAAAPLLSGAGGEAL